MRRNAVVLCAVILSACSGSDSPSAPTPTPVIPIQLAGAWTGTLSYTFDGKPYSHSLNATVSQDQLHVAATLTLSRDWNATLDGTLSGPTLQTQLTAHVTLDVPSDQPPIRCAAAFDSTSLVASTMTFRADSVMFIPCVDTITDVTLTLRH
jgi:hypothetical protein